MDTDIVLLMEPYYSKNSTKVYAPEWDTVCGPRSAILVRRDITHIPQPTTHPDIITTSISGTQIICVYTSPNEDINPALLTLHSMLGQQNARVIIGGDFNCTTSLIPGFQTND